MHAQLRNIGQIIGVTFGFDHLGTFTRMPAFCKSIPLHSTFTE